jgi:hypothetical protein
MEKLQVMEAKNRTLDDIKNDIARRAGRVNPFERVVPDEVQGLLGRLTSLDPDLWGIEWGKLGMRYEALGDEQEKLGKKDEAGKSYYQAYEYYRIGRYPVPSSPEKMNCYKGALRTFMKSRALSRSSAGARGDSIRRQESGRLPADSPRHESAAGRDALGWGGRLEGRSAKQ